MKVGFGALRLAEVKTGGEWFCRPSVPFNDRLFYGLTRMALS
jgi:hypothetical protein